MKFEKWKKFAFYLAIIGVVQFFVLCIIAMIFYPGGTELNPNIRGYSFFLNAYSDLGRVYSLSGELNTISRFLFVVALILINLFLIPFYLAMNSFFKGNRIESLFSSLATLSGIISVSFGIGTALYPADLYPSFHLSSAITFGIFSFFMLSFYTIPIVLNHSYPNRYGYITIFYTVLLAIYLLVILLNSPPLTEIGLIILVTGQKIVLFSGFICILVLALGAIKVYDISTISQQ